MRDFRTAIYAACDFLNHVQRIGGAACIRRQRKSPGVLAVITHLSAPKLAEPPNDQKRVGIRTEEREPLADDKISYGGQYVAALVADTSENARHAASLLKISYAPQKPCAAQRGRDAGGETAEAPPSRPSENQRPSGSGIGPRRCGQDRAHLFDADGNS